MSVRFRCAFMMLVLAMNAVHFAGCSRLRLPAIDSSGRRIFNPLPTTTRLALPGCNGESRLCNKLRGLGNPLNLGSCLPNPAFKDPADPPKCLEPAVPTTPKKKHCGIKRDDGPCVPSAPCSTECKDGPPAVLLGRECLTREYCRLPKRGKRGCILLSPQKIVAPVGGEVVLLSGICGTDGYLQMGEPLEWMLTPESVGTFIQVGDDDPGVLHRLARIKKAEKKDPSYALGVTSTKRTLITRGNLKPHDDVQLEKGQTWITVSSPSEGTSKVTVLAPESECWDQRKATSTIYWIDARWQYPGTEIVPAGTPVTLTTRVTRSEGTLPARGWKVRYEILQPELATFAGTQGSSYVEANVDEAGNATVQLLPTPGTAGTTAVAMSIIRPGGDRDNIPTLTVSEGQTFVTWSAPQLAIRAGAPQVASFGVPFEAVANVSNPGDQAAQNVRVTLQLPRGVRATSRDQFATNTPNAIVWEIGTLPPKSQLDLFADVVTESSFPLTFEARAAGELYAADTITVDVYRPSLVMSVTPQKERYEVGERVAFNIDVRNTGDRPLGNLQLTATGDQGMLHESNMRQVVKPKDNGPLQPGETWKVAVVFISTDPGQRTISVEATADGGQQTSASASVIAINRPPPTPAVTATLNGKARVRLGESALFRGVVVNTGRVPLENVEVIFNYSPQLQPRFATEEFLSPIQPGALQIRWLIPRLEPESSRTLEADFQTIGSTVGSNVTMNVSTQQGARANQIFEFQILPPAVNQPANPAPASPRTLPPASVTPGIPGPRPIPAPEQPSPSPIAPTPTPRAEPEAMELSLIGPSIAVRVNDPISYTLRIRNPSTIADSDVFIQLSKPASVRIVRVSNVLSAEPVQAEAKSDQIVFLSGIPSINPGEIVTYKIVLVSNQPQEFDFEAQVVSRGKPKKAISTTRTRVVP